jgi:hypothetical protein
MEPRPTRTAASDQFWTRDGELLAERDPNDRAGCNVRGHRVRQGTDRCEHCHAPLDQIATPRPSRKRAPARSEDDIRAESNHSAENCPYEPACRKCRLEAELAAERELNP